MTLKPNKNLLIPDRELVKSCFDEPQNVYLRAYYGTSWQDRIRSWIFMRRYSAILRSISAYEVKKSCILDVGCGPMFGAHFLIKRFNAGYIGLDLLPSVELRKYARVLELSAGCKVNVVRASAEHLPFRDKTFSALLCLDTLEHLQRPRVAMNEMNRVTEGYMIVSLPIENMFQKLVRLPILLAEGTLKDPTPEYHYIGPFRSYQEMRKELLSKSSIKSEYAPFRMIHKETLNFYAIHTCKTVGSLNLQKSRNLSWQEARSKQLVKETSMSEN